MTTNTEQTEKQKANLEDMPICADHDEDCIGVKCKTTCWLYQPEKGRCP
jgi:hypothetical protein